MDDQLILRFLVGECSNQELKEIGERVSEDGVFSDRLFELERLWLLKKESAYSEPILLDDAFNRFIDNMDDDDRVHDSQTSQRKTMILASWFKFVAAMLLGVVLSLSLYKFTKESPPPGRNIVEASYAQQAKLTLSDGSVVWLNSGSKLIYPTSFDGETRTVELSGEAYFEVSKSETVPFVVSARDVDIKVLGTSFNVKCYDDEETIVVLKEGKVELSNKASSQKMIMNPNEKVIYSDEKFHLIKDLNVDYDMSWLYNELKFENELLSVIVNTLERKYNVSINITNLNLKDSRFTCRTQSDATLNQVLDLLKSTRVLNYRIDNKKVEIY